MFSYVKIYIRNYYSNFLQTLTQHSPFVLNPCKLAIFHIKLHLEMSRQDGGVCHRGKIRKVSLHLKWYIAFSTALILNLSVPYCPQVLFWLLDVGISMHVGRDLHNLLPEVRDVGSILTEIKY